MLEAFVLGFWIIWSSDREVYPLSESLWFTLIAVILRQLTAFDLPIIDTYWMIFNGIVWAFAGLIFSIVGRIDSNFIISCVLAMIAGIGYFQLLQHLPDDVAKRYNDEGADELTFLDITASSDNRDTILHVIEAVASQVFIPLTVGGGVRTVADIRRLLNAGADKASINTAAVTNPDLVNEAAGFFGSQAIVVAVDAKAVNPENTRWEIFTHGGRNPTGLDAVEWAVEMQRRGAGEILLTSMDRDGTKQGFNLPLTRAVSEAVDIPVIASGGVGSVQHLVDGIKEGKADAVLAASIFHFGEASIREAKLAMREAGIEVRL